MGMRLIQVTIEHEFGDLVYLKTDPEAHVRIVVGWKLTPGTKIEYTLQEGNEATSDHYGFEIVTDVKDVEAAFNKLVT